MPGHDRRDAPIESLQQLGDALDATPAQRDALCAIANDNKRRNAVIFLTKPPGGPAPAHYVSDKVARGIDMDSELGRGMLGEYLAACPAPGGGNLLEALGQSNMRALEEAASVLGEAQAEQLRALLPMGLAAIDTGTDPMGEAMREAMQASQFATWEELRAAGAFPAPVATRLLDEFVVLKEQMLSVLLTVPAEGGESPLDYQARLVAADDPNAGRAFDLYLATRTDPAFGMAFRDVLERLERERTLWIFPRLEEPARAWLQSHWRQPILSLRLPGDRFYALLEQRIRALKTQQPIDQAAGCSMLPWGDFCRALLLTSAQEEAARALVGPLCTLAMPDAALEAEEPARAALEALLSPTQRRRWRAYARRSLLTLQS